MPDNPQKTSPAFALRILQWFCPHDLYESIAGDLEEQYCIDRQILGEQRASRRYYWNVLKFVRPSILFRHRIKPLRLPMELFKNYMVLMFRQVSKHKIHTMITLSGLTAALVFAMLICSYMFTESQVNASLAGADRIFILENENKDDAPFITPAPLAKSLREQYPQLVENYYRFWDRSITVSKDDKHFRLQSMIGDSTLLTITGFPILSGDRSRALSEVNSVVITKNVAMRFFNKTDVLGEMLTIRTETAGEKSFKITAVLDELPDNSISNIININAEVFLPLENAIDFGNVVTDDWNTGQMIGYIKTTQNALPEDVNRASNALVRQHGNEVLQQRMRPEAIPLLRYHFEQNNGAIGRLMFILGVSAIFILLMAIINFVNIMIGAAKTRMKEIGVRKSLGGLKHQIRFQFLMEAVMRACIAGIFAIGLYALVLPYFQEIIDKKLPGLLSIPLPLWIYFLLTVLLTGILAGIYPSIHLSAAKTLDSLKGKMLSVRGSINISRFLVGMQFMLAISAFIFSLVISRQVSFFLEKDLGYEKSAVLTVSSVPRVWGEEGVNRMTAAKREFLMSSAVENVSLSWEIPNENYGNTRRVYKSGSEQEKAISMPMLITDEDFLATYGISLHAGKFFLDEGESRQPGTIVINESAQKALGVSIGDKVNFVEGPGAFTVGGIVKDFNFFSLRQPMRPLIMMHTGEAQIFRYLSFKLSAGNLAASVEAVETKWKQIFPNDPFEYAFMDDKLMRLYKTEVQLKKTSRCATLLMIVIVLLGVIGLTSLNVARRTKEIGVRKVLGASIGNILLLISKDYVKIMLIAMAVSVPLAWYGLNSWLNGFAYRIGISWWMLILPGLLIGCATFITVCVQSLKAALSNPKEALRHE